MFGCQLGDRRRLACARGPDPLTAGAVRVALMRLPGNLCCVARVLRDEHEFFVAMMGWADMAKDPKGAVKTVLENDASGSQTEAHQTTMVEEVNKLVDGSDGMLDVAAADRTVATLLAGGSDPVITKKPEGAWTDVVMKAAMALK